MASTNLKKRIAWNKGIKTGIVPKSAFKKGHKHYHSPETRKKLSEAHKGKKTGIITSGCFKKGIIPWNKGIKHSPEVIKKMTKAKLGKKHTDEHKRKIGEAHKGSKSHYWKGGITSEVRTLRSSAKYRDWRMTVFARDFFTCQICQQVGGKLNAHHIKSFSRNKDLRFNINNGITLCEACHKKTDTFGGKGNKK